VSGAEKAAEKAPDHLLQQRERERQTAARARLKAGRRGGPLGKARGGGGGRGRMAAAEVRQGGGGLCLGARG
jgi:hypothetical protein